MLFPTQIPAFLCLVVLSGTPTAGALKGLPATTCCVTLLGTSGKLFCNFGVDLNETKHDFQVHRYDLDPADTEPDHVLVCYWKYPDILTCQANHNYAFNGNVSDEAVIEIPNFSQETEGRYSCQMIPPDAEVTPCIAKLPQGRPEPPLTESTSGHLTNPDTPNMDQPKREDAPSSFSQTSVVVIVVVVAVVLGAIVGIVAGLVLSFRFKLHKKAGKFLSAGNAYQSKKQNIYKGSCNGGSKEANQQHWLAPPNIPLLH